jgi:hypothetical protein
MNPSELQDTPPTNPLLKRATIPGQTFALPSLGAFYNNEELDPTVQNAEVMVLPMVTMDELIFKTPDKLLNGTAVYEVFRRCIPQVLKPEELLAKDVDFLLICLRKVTYGDEIQLSYTHKCANAKEHSYMVPLQPLISVGKKMHKERVQDYTLTLPNGQVVKLQPPKYRIMLKFYQGMNEEVSDEEMRNDVLDATVSLVNQVDNIRDSAMIREWFATIPAGYTKKISERVASISEWGPELQVEIVCKDCEKEVQAEISLNPIHFFS